MPTAIVTGSGGLIGSESVSRFVELGFDVVGLENDMRARFFGPEASTARTTDALLARHPDAFRSLADRYPRPRRGGARVRAARRPDRARHPCRRSALPRLGGVGPAHGLRGQRARHAQPARGHAPARRRRHVRALLDEQGLRRPAQLAAPARAPPAPGPARGPPLLRGHRHVDVDRPEHPLAVRRVQGRGRSARAGVRALLRSADRLLPRWLPDRPEPRRRRCCTGSSPT